MSATCAGNALWGPSILRKYTGFGFDCINTTLFSELSIETKNPKKDQVPNDI